MTTEERKRLAEEARRLAMECLTNGPAMDAESWCGCAIGLVVERAGLGPNTELAMRIDEMLTDDPKWFGLVSLATNERVYMGNPTAVVFPLLALADVLDESVEDARSAK